MLDVLLHADATDYVFSVSNFIEAENASHTSRLIQALVYLGEHSKVLAAGFVQLL